MSGYLLEKLIAAYNLCMAPAQHAALIALAKLDGSKS